MKRINYNKLVRDRIPEIIEREGKPYGVEVMPADEYRQALLAKLVEEAAEAGEASGARLATELADLLEVVDALIAANDLDRNTVFQVQAQRREERGGFEKQLKLLWVDEKEE